MAERLDVKIDIDVKPLQESLRRIAAAAAATTFSLRDVAQAMRIMAQLGSEDVLQELDKIEPEPPREKLDLKGMVRSIRFQRECDLQSLAKEGKNE